MARRITLRMTRQMTIKTRRTHAPAFSLLEILISLAIVAVLVGLLVPCLIYARDSARTTVCAANLKQIGTGWQLYLHDWDRFPGYPEQPDWKYGGVVFRTSDNEPVLATDRPINKYIADDTEESRDSAMFLFRCPADAGIFQYPRGGRPGHAPSVLENGTCFATFGSSYRANPYLLDTRLAGMEGGAPSRPLRLSEVSAANNRLLMIGDPEWFYATRSPNDPEAFLDATWHNVPAAGNMVYLDGSLKFRRFDPSDLERGGQITLQPRR